jgi:pyruvyl transferase EpsI
MTKRAIQFLTPHHDNVGDNAQAWMIKNILSVFFGNNILSFQLPDTENGLRQVKPDDYIFLGSGGYLGDLWPRGEQLRRKIIRECKNNIIVSFPQSVHFDNLNEIKESYDAYKSHSNLYLSTRDPESYILAKYYFPDCNIFQMPDPVFAFSHNSNYKRDKILCIFRNDKEDYLKTKKEDLIKIIKSKGFEIDIIDTEQHSDINRKPIENMDVNFPNYLDNISKYKCVVTDRFHGTIFSAITGTPCYALPTIDHKVTSCVYWHKQFNTKLEVYTSTEAFDKYLDKIPEPFCYNKSKAFSIYTKIISSIISNNKLNLNEINLVQETIDNRRTIRKWKATKIPNNVINDIIHTGVNAPSGANSQCVRFKPITDSNLLNKFYEFHKYKKDGPPLIILVGYDFGVKGTVNYNRNNKNWEVLKYQDVAASIENMLLYCESVGLACCWLSYLLPNYQEFLTSIGIKDDNIEYFSGVAIGVPQIGSNEIKHNDRYVIRQSIEYYIR